MTHCFVYGSLKKGFHNSRLFDPRVDKFIIDTTTKDAKYDLISLGAFPAAITGGKFKIQGELWDITDPTLERFDILESNGHLYQRHEISLDNFAEKAWMYFWIDKNRISQYSNTENMLVIQKNIKVWARNVNR